MGGGDIKQDRAQQQKSWQSLQDIFGVAKGAATGFQAKGTAATDAATKYWQTLLSGNRQQLAAATAPEAQAARASGDAAKRQEATFGTSRGGGTAGANRELDDKVRAQIDSLIGSMRSTAAGKMQDIGAQQISQMLQSLGIGTGATEAVGGQSTTDIGQLREQQSAMWGALIGAPATVVGAYLGGRGK